MGYGAWPSTEGPVEAKFTKCWWWNSKAIEGYFFWACRVLGRCHTIGNGRLGDMIWGCVPSEKLQLNGKSINHFLLYVLVCDSRSFLLVVFGWYNTMLLSIWTAFCCQRTHFSMLLTNVTIHFFFNRGHTLDWNTWQLHRHKCSWSTGWSAKTCWWQKIFWSYNSSCQIDRRSSWCM